MGKAIKTALMAALVVALVIVTAGAMGATVAPLFTGTGALAGMHVAVQFAVMTFATTLISAGIGMMTSKGIEANSANFGTKITSRNNLQARQIIYGETRCAGTITMMRTTGTDNNKLSMYVVFAGHEVEGFTGLYINDKLVTTTSSTSSGAGTDNKIYLVTSSDFVNTDNDHDFGSGRLIRFTFHDGSQTSRDTLANSSHGSTVIDSNFVLQGCAYMYIEMIYDTEKLPQLPNINMKIKGKKVYDPRTTSVAWSDNPALCIRDYLSDTNYGLKCTSDELNDTSNAGGFQSAANTCEQSVTLGGVTEERYTANGFTNFSADGTGIVEGLLSAMGGKLTFTNGKFNVFVGAAQTPSLTITDDDLLSAVSVSRNTQANELFNCAKSVFVDKNNNFVATDSPELTSSTGGTAYLNIDTPSGESTANYKKRMEIQLPYTNTVTTAERLTKIALQHQRQTEQLSLLTTTQFLRLQPADWVYVTNERLGYSGKTFEVVSTQLEFVEQDEIPVAACRLVVKAITSATYDFVQNDYVTPVTNGNTSEVPTGSVEITAPSSLTLSQILVKEGGVSKINVLASWSENTSPYVFATEVSFKTSGQSDFQAITVGRGTETVRIPNVAVGETYNIKVRHVSTFGTYSAHTSTSNITITAATEAPNAPTSLTASTGKALNILVQFTNSNSADLKAVKIYRKTSNSAPSSDTDGLVHTMSGVNGQVSTWLDGKHNGLTAGTTYYYWAKAVNTSDVVSSLVGSASGSFTNVATGDLLDDAITNAKIAVNAIQGDVIAASAITTAKLGPDAVTTAKIADAAITATQIGNDAITTAKIADDAITSALIADDAIGTAQIANDAITNALIATDAVNADSIVANAITATEIATNAITANKISAGAITTAKLAADSITTAKIAAAAITASEIGASAITTAKLEAGAITTAKLAAGAVTADEIGANAITSAKINAGAVTADEIASNAITTAKINANAITAAKIGAGEITAAKIATDAITAVKIAANAVTAAKINVTSLSAITADMGTITAGSITAGSVAATTLNLNGATLTADSNGLKLNLFDAFTHINADTMGNIEGTGGNDVAMGNMPNIVSDFFLDAQPKHISDTLSTTADPAVRVGSVMGNTVDYGDGSPLFSYNFTTPNFSGTRKYLVSVHVDPIGAYNSGSASMFAFAMRATTNATLYNASNPTVYVTTRGTSIGGSRAGSSYTLTDVVNLTGNTSYYVWVFGALEDVGDGGHPTIDHGILNGSIMLAGLAK